AKGALLLCLLLAACGAAAWFGREVLLRGAAEMWIVSDNLGPADAAAIFGGGLSVRPFAAAEYYRTGLVKKILVADILLDEQQRLGVLPSHIALNRNVLGKLGVPETAIEAFGTGLTNTYTEAVALRQWAQRSDVRSIIVPTEIFSSRRVRWVLKQVFADTGIEIHVSALDPPNYSRRQWWRSDQGLLNFQNEVIKYVGYRFKY